MSAAGPREAFPRSTKREQVSRLTRTLALILLLALATCALIVSDCVSGGRDVLPQDRYLAVEEQLIVECRLINGTYPEPMFVAPPPTFVYDGVQESSYYQPHSGYYPAVNDSFKILYGTLYSREIVPGFSNDGLKIMGVYSFPYTGESGFTIQDIAGDGTIHASYNKTPIVLKVGEQWVFPITSENKSRNGTGGVGNKPYSFTAMYSTTWTVRNLGIYDKANLTGYDNSESDSGFYQSFSVGI